MSEFNQWLEYPASLEKKSDMWKVQLNDFVDVHAEGCDRKQIYSRAQEALNRVLAISMTKGKEVPWPGKARKTDVLIPVSAHVAAPLLLYLTRRQQDLSMAEVARRLKVTCQAYQRMEKVGGNLTLKNLERAAAAMGAAVELRMIPLSRIGKGPRK